MENLPVFLRNGINHPVALVGKKYRSLFAFGGVYEYQLGFDIAFAYYYGGILFDDSPLFPRYVMQCVAQEPGVIETYVGYRTRYGCYYVGRIEPAPFPLR